MKLLIFSAIHLVLTVNWILAGDVLDENLEEELFVKNELLITPVSMAWAPDNSNRLFIVNQFGEVFIIQDGEFLEAEFYNFTQTHKTSNENGLLGIAFDPEYRENGYIYFFLSVSANEQQIIRLTDNSNVGEDETIIIHDLPTAGGNHNGGALAIGPDNKLYWGVGDNNDGNPRGLDNLKSKVGRSNLDGSVPEDNPFYDDGNPEEGNNDYIWARGFRNPFSMTFRPGYDELWLNVVGGKYEQIFIVEAGDDGAWYDNSGMELNVPPDFISPVFAYGTRVANSEDIASISRTNGTITVTLEGDFQFHQGEKVNISGVTPESFNGAFDIASVDLGSQTVLTLRQDGDDESGSGGTATSTVYGGCITGGAFTSANGYGEEYDGDFFFGDYNGRGKIMRMRFNEDGSPAAVDVVVDGAMGIVDIAVGPDGLLYYTGTGYIGDVYRLVPKDGQIKTKLRKFRGKPMKTIYTRGSLLTLLKGLGPRAMVEWFDASGRKSSDSPETLLASDTPSQTGPRSWSYMRITNGNSQSDYRILLLDTF